MKTSLASANWPDQTNTFLNLLNIYRSKELFCDCVLACERRVFHAHKIVLAMCSEFFETILSSTPDKTPVIILNEVEAWQLECLLNYMYNGETTVPDVLFPSLCRVAKYLQIKGFDMVEMHRNAVKISSLQQSDSLFRMAKAPEPMSDIDAKEVLFKKFSHKGVLREKIHESWNGYGQQYWQGSKYLDYQQIPPTENSNSPFKKMDSPLLNQHLEVDTSKRDEYISNPKLQAQSIIVSSGQDTDMPRASSCKNVYNADTMFRPISNQPTAVKKERETESMTSTGPFQSISTELEEKVSSICRDKSDRKTPDDFQLQKRGPPPLLRMDLDKNCLTHNDEDKQMNRNKVEDIPPVENHPHSMKRETYQEDGSLLHAKPSFHSEAQLTSPTFSHQSLESENSLDVKSSASNSEECLPLNLTSRSYSPVPTIQRDPLLKKIHTNKRKRVRGPRSWEFLLRLLRDKTSNPTQIRWEDEENGIFRLIEPDLIALRWGRRTAKNGSETLSYDSFARGLRYHYATGALNAVSEKSFVYQFGPKAMNALAS